MATAVIDGIRTRYEVLGSGPPLLMYSPAGFDATLDKWSTQGVYARIRLLDHLPKKYTCIVFDRRECGADPERAGGVAAVIGVCQDACIVPGFRPCEGGDRCGLTVR